MNAAERQALPLAIATMSAAIEMHALLECRSPPCTKVTKSVPIADAQEVDYLDQP